MAHRPLVLVVSVQTRRRSRAVPTARRDQEDQRQSSRRDSAESVPNHRMGWYCDTQPPPRRGSSGLSPGTLTAVTTPGTWDAQAEIFDAEPDQGSPTRRSVRPGAHWCSGGGLPAAEVAGLV